MRRILLSLPFLFLSMASVASAASPDCSDASFPVPLSAFSSCVVSGGGPAGQDRLANVQAALDLALDPDISLDSTGSYCPGGGCGGSEFFGSRPADDFVIDPSSVVGSTSFTFEQIPAGTLFITLKQGNAFEVFKVPGATPFTLTHMLTGTSTSHISTFAAVPEPTTLTLLGSAVILALVFRQHGAGRRAAGDRVRA